MEKNCQRCGSHEPNAYCPICRDGEPERNLFRESLRLECGWPPEDEDDRRLPMRHDGSVRLA